MLQAEWLVARNHKHKTMPGPLVSYPKPYVPSRMLCKPEEVYEWSHDNAKSIEVTAVVCPALLCAFSSCSLAFFPLIFLSFLLPLGWYHCFSNCHTKLSCSSTQKRWQLQLYWCGGCDPASSLMTSSSWPLFSHLATLV